jgi:hypothetical protein
MKLLSLIVFSFLIYSNKAFSIIVTDYNPAPNYVPTQSVTDKQELTDGKIYAHPAWNNKGSVGWTYSSAIKFDITLDNVSNQQCSSGILKVVSAKKENSQVKLPRRIDIYGNNKHLKELVIDNESYVDDKAYTFEVELNQVPNKIQLILHAGGPYVMVDEISWEPKDICSTVSRELVGQTNSFDIKKDSKQRLLNQLNLKVKPALTEKLPLTVWFEDAWGDLPTLRPTLNLPTENISRSVIGGPGSKQYTVLGVSGACEPGKSYQITTNKPSKVVKKLSLFQIKEQLTFNGNLVYDPLLPITNALPCQDSAINTYLWLAMDLNNQTSIPSENIAIEVKGVNGESLKAEIKVNVNNLGKVQSCSLDAINWAYSFDQPIWTISSQAYDDLNAHNINVFVVPPWLISLPNFDGKKVMIESSRLWLQISPALTKNRNAKFLLYMAVDKWLETNQSKSKAEQEKQLTNWVKAVDQFFTTKRLARNQWMLYPIDEPIGAKLDQLEWAAKLIKAVNPEIQIYANPIAAYNNSVSTAQLTSLQSKIDLFQPSVRLVGEQLSFFQSLKKAWWIYENPQSPAKSTQPAFYRALGIKAWAIGASGIGFWSYSDTGLSSAWDDFDGNQPDWAVVYENPKSIVSSRRWEAFSKGVQDNKDLCQIERNDKNATTVLKQQINSNINKSKEVIGIMDDFLNNYRKP